ncbi:degenerin-like protein unc-105 [Saccoglossus kowalevskii]
MLYGNNIYFTEPSPTYQPSAHDLLKRYTELSYDLSVYEDFVTNSYHDHQFGRVKSEDPPDWPGFITYSSTPDYSDLENVLKLRADEIAELGHQLEDFVLECSYDEQVCNWEKDFKMFQDERYGNCFQFNHAFDSEDTSLYSTKTGAKYGLKMTLYTEQNEYISVYGRNSGARVVVHPPHIPAIPQSEGITVTPGRVSSVGLKENRIKRKPSPYGECTTITEYESIFGDHYKITVCEETCMQTYMSKYCGCVDTMLSNDTRCMQLNRTQDVCRQLIRYFGRKELLDCKCKQPCEETYYGTTISQSLWPSDTYLEHFLKQIHSKNNKTTFINGFDDVR